MHLLTPAQQDVFFYYNRNRIMMRITDFHIKELIREIESMSETQYLKSRFALPREAMLMVLRQVLDTAKQDIVNP
ncbi:MAG: hypothetical protein K1X92_09380 [Bacteroidia bacterium]|nr:hypothetical protein [Bacteroidia bacterium]